MSLQPTRPPRSGSPSSELTCLPRVTPGRRHFSIWEWREGRDRRPSHGGEAAAAKLVWARLPWALNAQTAGVWLGRQCTQGLGQVCKGEEAAKKRKNKWAINKVGRKQVTSLSHHQGCSSEAEKYPESVEAGGQGPSLDPEDAVLARVLSGPLFSCLGKAHNALAAGPDSGLWQVLPELSEHQAFPLLSHEVRARPSHPVPYL